MYNNTHNGLPMCDDHGDYCPQDCPERKAHEQSLGRPAVEEGEKMSTKEKIEAVANAHRQVKAMERQAKGFQFEAALLKREILEPHIEVCKSIVQFMSVDGVDGFEKEIDSLKKVIEFSECVDEP